MEPLPTTATDRKQTRIQQQNRDRILAAALHVFSRFGYRGSTVDQIAAESGMSKANLLYYFRRKQDIYLEVLSATLREWLQPLETLDPDGEPIEELWRYTQAKLELSRQSPEASRLFANEILQGAPMIRPFLTTDLKALVNRQCQVIQRWIDRKQLASIDPMHLLFMIWAATQHYADFAPQIDALSDDSEESMYDNAERTLKTILCAGLKPQG